jgi:hypothetical protein
MGPLIDGNAYEAMQQALASAKAASACITGGFRVLKERYPTAFYVSPALVELDSQADSSSVRRLPQSSIVCPTGISTRRSPSRTTFRKDSPPPYSHKTCARPRLSCQPSGRTAASRM